VIAHGVARECTHVMCICVYVYTYVYMYMCVCARACTHIHA